MKITTFLMIAFCMQVSAESYSQKITISEKNAPLQKVFKEIEKQSGYVFWYESSLISSNSKVNVSVKNAELNEVLELCLADQPLSYSIMGRTIVLKEKVPVVLKDIEPTIVLAIPPITVKGKVTDENGVPITGVTIMVKGDNKGTQTDVDGNYSLTNVSDNAILVITAIGYEKKEVSVANKTTLNIKLRPKIDALEETVVVAYGTSKVKDVTGSISHIGVQDIKNAPMGATIQSLIQGRAAGVNVQIQSASPTAPVSVIIRGASSLTGSNQPLWVIDGVPDYSASTSGDIYNTLYNLNLSDVESIDILKDASATALYGSRAANGVVIVTTKKGRKGMLPTIELTSRVGYQTQDFNGYKYMTSPAYMDFTEKATKEGVMTLGGFDVFTSRFLDEQAFMNLNTSEFDKSDLKLLEGGFYGGNTDWMKEMTRNPLTNQHTLSLRGGTPDIAYFVSLNTSNTDGIIKSGNSQISGGRVNLEAKLKKGVKFGLNLNGSSRLTNVKDYMMSVLKKIRPDIPAYNPDGTIFTLDPYTENPYTTLLNTANGDGQSFSGTGYLEFSIKKGLMLKTSYTSNYSNNQSLSYKRSGSEYNYNGARSWSNGRGLTMVWENTLTYAKNVGKHDFLGLVGFSMEKNSSTRYGMEASNFPDDDVLNDFGSGSVRGALSETYSANSLVSSFSRATYKYNNKYIISGTVRQDGSSRFGPDKRWGFFPSAAAAWLISEEGFMKSDRMANAVSYLKLRASIGLTGSQNLGNYAWRTGIGSSRYNELPAMTPSSIGNTELQWEQTRMTDLGLDFGFWNDRIRGSFGLYQKLTEHLIYNKPLPPSSSFSNISSNVASLKNDGIEFDIKVDVIEKRNLRVSVDFNAGRNINRLIKINGVAKRLDFPNSTTFYMRTEEGERTGQWFGFQTANRLFVNQEEIIAYQGQTNTGSKQYYRNSLERPGDLIFIDQNKDGKIDNDDKVNLGSADPKIFGGFGATAIFKGLMVNATFTYSYGNMRLWKQPMDDAIKVGNFNQSNLIAGKSATVMSPYEATMPRLTMNGDGNNGAFSDFWLYDASYIKLSALNFSYRIPDKMLNNTFIQGVDISFQASNLFTITNYPGFDPQGNWNSSSIGTGMGIDYSIYPSAKNYNLGFKFTFK